MAFRYGETGPILNPIDQSSFSYIVLYRWVCMEVTSGGSLITSAIQRASSKCKAYAVLNTWLFSVERVLAWDMNYNNGYGFAAFSGHMAEMRSLSLSSLSICNFLDIIWRMDITKLAKISICLLGVGI